MHLYCLFFVALSAMADEDYGSYIWLWPLTCVVLGRDVFVAYRATVRWHKKSMKCTHKKSSRGVGNGASSLCRRTSEKRMPSSAVLPTRLLVTSARFKSPTAWCSQRVCDSRLGKDSREIIAPQNTSASTIPRQTQLERAVCDKVPAFWAPIPQIWAPLELAVLGKLHNCVTGSLVLGLRR